MKPSIPLGQQTSYPDHYDASLLFPVPRADAREQLPVDQGLPFVGEDCWTAYELSWLDNNGKPQVRLGEFYFDYDSPNIVESKSFKLYLNSFNQTSFASEAEVVARLQQDLSSASGSPCRLQLYSLDDAQALSCVKPSGHCIDELDVQISEYTPMPSLLAVDTERQVEKELLYSHLLKTNCPVTGQPDWATVFIEYTGHAIKRADLLAYIISFRGHQDFHENCVERIFCDIQAHCEPTALSVCARYTRRGGLDINPLRTNVSGEAMERLQQRIKRQ